MLKYKTKFTFACLVRQSITQKNLRIEKLETRNQFHPYDVYQECIDHYLCWVNIRKFDYYKS